MAPPNRHLRQILATFCSLFCVKHIFLEIKKENKIETEHGAYETCRCQVLKYKNLVEINQNSTILLLFENKKLKH